MVVELAHFLFINKTFGTKILITSHNRYGIGYQVYLSKRGLVGILLVFIWQSKVKVQIVLL